MALRRPKTSVRAASGRDVASLVPLWAEARRVAGPAARVLGPASESAVRARVERAAHDADARLVVAETEGEVVGFACFCLEAPAPFEDPTSVRVAYLHVAERARRQGAGSALVDAAAAYAEECRAAEVVVAVPSNLREANRFYARLALLPAVAHRSVPTVVLRRHLAGDAGLEPVEMEVRRRRARALLSAPRPFRARASERA